MKDQISTTELETPYFNELIKAQRQSLQQRGFWGLVLGVLTLCATLAYAWLEIEDVTQTLVDIFKI